MRAQPYYFKLATNTGPLMRLFGIEIFSHINYFGHKIKLRKLYFGLLSYELDYGKNIPLQEAARLERIIETIPFGPLFRSADERRSTFVSLRFPGYSSFFANQRFGKPEQKLELMSVEIPRSKKERYLVTKAQEDGSELVVADFVGELSGVTNVRERGDVLEFLSREGAVKHVLARPGLRAATPGG